MDLEAKKAALNSSLERAAEDLGDITPHVMAAYYARNPKPAPASSITSPAIRASSKARWWSRCSTA